MLIQILLATFVHSTSDSGAVCNAGDYRCDLKGTSFFQCDGTTYLRQPCAKGSKCNSTTLATLGCNGLKQPPKPDECVNLECIDGSYLCKDLWSFYQCSNGRWTLLKCATGTACNDKYIATQGCTYAQEPLGSDGNGHLGSTCKAGTYECSSDSKSFSQCDDNQAVSQPCAQGSYCNQTTIATQGCSGLGKPPIVDECVDKSCSKGSFKCKNQWTYYECSSSLTWTKKYCKVGSICQKDSECEFVNGTIGSNGKGGPGTWYYSNDGSDDGNPLHHDPDDINGDTRTSSVVSTTSKTAGSTVDSFTTSSPTATPTGSKNSAEKLFALAPFVLMML